MHSKTVFALALAAAFCYAAPPPVHAQPDANTSDATTSSGNDTALPQAASQAAQMVPAEAVLAQNLDAKKLQPGQQFKAVLQGKVQLKNGVELPRGTALIGTVANDNSTQGAKSELALRFTQADLKDGKTIPIVATIVGVSPASTQDVPPAISLYNAPPDSWDGRTLEFNNTEALSGIDLHSRIAGQNSGVFVSGKSNLKLGVRTQLALAIGAENNNGPNGGSPNGGY